MGALQLDIADVEWVGRDLARPECVVCDDAGTLHVADWRGGITTIAPDGSQHTILSTSFPLKPNGICLAPDGGYLIAHLGDTDGGIYHLAADGTCRPVALEADGAPLPPTNFVHADAAGRIWATVSTRHQPRAAAYRSDIADGFVARIEGGHARIAADGLGYTNECLVDPSGQWLYVNETFARRLSRLPIRADGDLGPRETVAEFGTGIFPDGLAFAPDRGLWIVSIVSNSVLRLDRDGTLSTVLADPDPAHVDRVEAAYRAHAMGRPHLDNVGDTTLKNISSLAFHSSGHPTGRRVYLGCLLGDRIASFALPANGAG